MFSSSPQLQDALSHVLKVQKGSVTILDGKKLRASLIDALATTAVFSPDDDLKEKTRNIIFGAARTANCPSSSISPLYHAFGQEKVKGFTVPAVNIRALTYDTARVIFRLMIKRNIGAVVFEIARSEIEYTDQRPAEYTTAVLAAAIKEGYSGPVFLQGDHYQFSKSKFTADKNAEIERLKGLIRESIEGHFLNIDIDASTLVDLSQNNLNLQQKNNYEMTALLTEYIRSLEPEGVTISIGGEIGHIGGQNSTVSDFEAFMQGYRESITDNGMSKVSVQTGTSHGGIPLPDGSMQEVSLDFNVLHDISTVARARYHMGGAVQHGASTLPLPLFDKFVDAKTLEIHLATGFQNIVYDHIPKELRGEMYMWIKENLQEEREEGWSDEQFLYKTRKKALGAFKQPLWEMSDEEKEPILTTLNNQFETIFSKLKTFNTKELVDKQMAK